ncbi:MAG: hypothetical protein NXI15_01020 [Gammaproteobacteria bacterium]|nr:hypothetical protein [Gammaproteobacteria bacterium]
MSEQDVDTVQALRAAWDDMIQSLQEARDAIDHPELMPPPGSERNLAEGYRYLMGFVHYGIERAFHEDPQRPHFRNALSIINRSTIDNADAVYFYAPLDGKASYRLQGKVEDWRHWRNEPPLEGQPKAPFYLIFETMSGVMAGDSGSLRELTPGVKVQTGRLDSSELQVEADGSFEILLAPERPADYSGNFIATLKVVDQPHPFDPDVPAQRYANVVSGRQLFCDWENEVPIHLELEQIGAEGTHGAPYDAVTAAAQIRQCGDLVRSHMRYWNEFWTILMGTYGEREGSIPGVAFPRNAFNQVNAAAGSTGGGQSTNLYAGGVFELAPDEALIIENRVQVPPQYIGFQLGNLWGESIEYANQTGSLNGYQMTPDEDGVFRMVVAHRDPGVANWLDTSGHPEGFLTARWAYSSTPDKAEWPQITASKVRFDDIAKHLPENTARLDPAQRRQQVRIRQRHVRRRYRAF